MRAESVGTLILAACAVLGSIGAVLALSFRVGRLTGQVQAAISRVAEAREDDRQDASETRRMILTHLAAHAGRHAR